MILIKEFPPIRVWGTVDFFNISGSLFVEKESKPSMKSSAQGLFMLMTNGLGAILGSYASGFVVDYFTQSNGIKNWQTIWFVFAVYTLLVTIVFAYLFKYKHNPVEKTDS